MQRPIGIALFASSLGLWLGTLVLPGVGASPNVKQALQLAPIQPNIECDHPEANEIDQCKISAKRIGAGIGWEVADSNGTTLRQFVDTNGDNVVDRWCYYKDGLEIYRDIDLDSNGKADQYRWFHTAGSRWGIDRNEDGTIDTWKAISAEEVTAEVVAAISLRDAARFTRVVLTDDELASLGLGPSKAKELRERIGGIEEKFETLASRQTLVTGETKWVQFSGNQPGLVPAGTDESTHDISVYENVVAVVQTGNAHGQVLIGTLVKVDDGWRVLDLPQPISEGQDQVSTSGFFFRSPVERQATMPSGGPTEQDQALLAQLEQLDAASVAAGSPAEQAKFNARRADLLEQIVDGAEGPEERAMWIRQLADMVSAAVQSGGYPEGADRLTRLFEKLDKEPAEETLAAYVKFRQLTAQYGLAIQAPGADFVKTQADWLEQLEQYVSTYPTSPDTAEAMLQLAITQEFAGQEKECREWYGRVVKEFPTSPSAKKASGALTRLGSVGKAIGLRGQSLSGSTVDLAAYRGKVVLIQFWATWCEPCLNDMTALKGLVTQYGRSGFSVIGVNLDSDSSQLNQFLSRNRIPWPQIVEDGGLDSRPANELGILTLPTMILVDQSGKVVNRNVQVAELDRELKKLIR